MTVRIALLSDVHANLPALEAVLGHVEAGGPWDGIYHLGDLVGYAPWPNEVVATLRSAGIAGVSGNYDTTVATRYRHCGCRSENPRQEALAHRSFEWTLRHTAEETRRWLAALPFRLDLRPLGGHQAGPTLRLLHGSDVLNTVYVTGDRADEFLAAMADRTGAKPGDVIAFGHTHKPWHREVGGVHFVNTGSVGRPKDGDARACYVALALGAGDPSVEIIRVPYDVERAAAGILASDLPGEFAEFLRAGGEPGPARG